ncbi:hypothetical protein SAMN05661080_00916 [Modestobacter sp. DSM 44400]|uniref:hypothetical protein n=1 Tax=Modestobacter sp. DSM 44400 TaxID=1550230 RepID=UPI00089D73AC|nr:hypothetical protein [Modestobacter sp. DSM 44400]SDX71325.1 hypothetical protein SAMN05661080_00916 [Modestobacter sp. DSM 44400]
MSAHSLLSRCSTVVALILTGGLALVGGVSLHGTGVAAVGLAGAMGACLTAGIARESATGSARATTVEAAWRTGVGVVAVLLVLSGSAALAGGAALVVVAPWAAVVALAWWSRGADARPAGPPHPSGSSRPGAGPAAPARPAARPPSARRERHPSSRGPGHPPLQDPAHPATSRPEPAARPAAVPGVPPVAATDLSRLSMEALGREWLRTGSALEAAVDPAVRAQVAHRRREALDELERRDPVGFARWLAAGATADSNPAQYLRGDWSAGSGTA